MRSADSFDWTPAAIARLTELWLCGNSGGEIGRWLGISRSAVMGKLRRLDMLCRDRPRMPIIRHTATAQKLLKTTEQVSRPKKRPHKRNKRPLPPPEPYQEPPPPPLPAYDTLTVLDLRHNSCRWPSEGDSPWTFCGRPQTGDSSYCPEHRARSMGSQSRSVPFYLAKLGQGA